MIVVSWQARLCLNKRWKCYSLSLETFESGRMHINIRFQTPAKLGNGDHIFKYWLLRPGEAQKWGLFHSNICFFAPVKLRSGDYSFKYLLSRPSEAQKRGLFIQIFAFSPRWNSKAGLIHSNICILVPVQSRSGLNTFTDRHIQIHIKQITRSEILRNIVE